MLKKKEIRLLTEKLAAFGQNLEISDKKYAEKSTEFCHLKIKDKVQSENLISIDTEINKTWEDMVIKH